MQNRARLVKVWYVSPNNGPLFAPSKYIAWLEAKGNKYGPMTAEDYIKRSTLAGDQGIDGREPERFFRSTKWFSVVDPRSDLWQDLNGKLGAFLDGFNVDIQGSVRIMVPPAYLREQTRKLDDDALFKLVVAVASRFSASQRAELISQLPR